MDKLSDIVIFARVVEAGSFTAAADQLSMSKSVVSKYVSRLEERLGAKLFHRTTRRLSLTEAGQTFYERTQPALGELEAAEDEISVLQAEPRGNLKINAPMSFGVMHIAPVIPDFLERYPELTVNISFDDRKIDFIEGGFDASVRISDLNDSSLVARRVGPCRHVIVASPDYLQRRGTPRTPDELVEHNIVTYQYQTSPHRWEFQAAGKKPVSVSISGSIQMNSSLAIREAVLAGAGISRMPTFAVGEDIRSGTLHPLLREYKNPEKSIYVVFPPRRHLAPKIRAFVEFLVESLKEKPLWDSFV